MPNIVKNTTFPGLFSLLAPHSCRGCGRIGSPLCNRCKNYIIQNHQNVCPVCRTTKNPVQTSKVINFAKAHSSKTPGSCPNCPALPPTFIVGSRDDLLGDLIHALKYDSVRALARPLAEILDQTLPVYENSVIVPLPTIGKHIRERGFSHTHLIAKHFARLRPSCQVADLLTRTKSTVQVGSSRETRLSQASSAYGLVPHAKIDPATTYILFDDVWTTGASMQAAYQLLSDAGAGDIVLALLARS